MTDLPLSDNDSPSAANALHGSMEPAMKIPRLVITATIALLGLTACGERPNSRMGADSALAKDLALAGQQTAQPSFEDTAVAPAPIPRADAREALPAPVRARTGRQQTTQSRRQSAQAIVPRPTPAPTPAAVLGSARAAAHGEIGTGTSIALTSGIQVCTSTNLPGDKLVATVNDAVAGSNGAVIPAGSAVVLEVASVTPGQTPDAARIAFRVRSIVVNDRTYTVAAHVAPLSPLERTKVAGTDVRANKTKVIGGAIVGALIGRMMGRDVKGTIIGAAAGAATGAAVAKSGERWEGCLPAGAPLRLTLDGPIVMS